MKKPEIVLIAAVAEENLVIGIENRLPWHISEDLRRFKRLTKGYPLVMGRKTFNSLIEQFGGPLPHRRPVVLTSQPDKLIHPAAEPYPSLEAALNALADQERVFIGGGQSVYEATLPIADRLELTMIEGHYEGDTYFPAFQHLVGPLFQRAEQVRHDGFRFDTYLRLPSL